MNKEYEISIIRIISTLCIVACHIQQYFGNTIGSWFNVGVQIFFFMSGYLLGTDTPKNSKWLFKRLKRILVDYYIYILIVVWAYLAILPDSINLTKVIYLLSGKIYLQGIEHFWFIRALLLCYVHVLIIDYLANRLSKCNLLLKIISTITILYWIYYFSIEVAGHWLIIFIGGYLVRKLFKTEKSHVCITFLLSIPTIVFTYYRIVNETPAIEQWWHVFAGSFLFMLLYCIFRKIKFKFSSKIKSFFDFTDKYTYDVYIVHQIFILGNFSVLALTDELMINYIILFSLILISALILFIISQFVNKIIDSLLTEEEQ